MIGSLRYHLNKSYNKIESTLMSRMVRTALVCHGLTVSQKYGIFFCKVNYKRSKRNNDEKKNNSSVS